MNIDQFNKKITQHSSMIHRFNEDCAGKQSESAHRAAQNLNKR